ncbi:MAG: tRNA (guanosine(46)-N(7))-methyltransferase TrmB [Bdellovibrionales bacterium]
MLHTLCMRKFDPRQVPRPHLDEIVRARLEQGDFDLEIGAGQGLHAIQYCQRNPNRTLIAVERTRVKFNRLSQRQAHHPELHNLLIVHADAISLVSHFIPDESLNRIILLYPNPYPKARQANRRWHNSAFMALLLQRLRRGGDFLFATNLDWYAEEARAAFEDLWHLRRRAERRITRVEHARTHFEKKYLARGEICFDFEFEK